MRAACSYILHTHLTSKWCFFSPLEPIGPRLLQATSLGLAAMFPPCSCIQSIFHTCYNSQRRICHNSIATWFQQTSTTKRYYKLSQKSIQTFTEIAMHTKTMLMKNHSIPDYTYHVSWHNYSKITQTWNILIINREILTNINLSQSLRKIIWEFVTNVFKMW